MDTVEALYKFYTDDYLREQNEFGSLSYDNPNISVFDVFSDKLDLNQFPGADFWI